MNDVFYVLAKEAETLAYAELLAMPKTSHPFEDIFRQKYGELVVNKCILLGNFAYESDIYPGAVIKEHFEMDEVK